MLVSLSFLVAMETKIIFSSVYIGSNINISIDLIREHCSELNLLQLSHTLFFFYKHAPFLAEAERA